MASSFTGTSPYKPGGNSPQAGGQADVLQKGIVTILDIEVTILLISFVFDLDSHYRVKALTALRRVFNRKQ